MKGKLIFALALVMALAAPPAGTGEQEGRRVLAVGGERHGSSIFPLVDYPETRPRTPGVIDFSHYHQNEEILHFLESWAAKYSDILDLYSVGKSFEGRDIWQVTVTNKKTGPDVEKPGFYLEGNRHSQEVTTAVASLYFLHHVLTNYGKDPEITKVVDTKALYVRVRNNPDGAHLYLNTAQFNRSTVRPHDSDGDGLLDEDPPDDLDGDGYCRQMRIKVGPGRGDHILEPLDPSGRLMKPVGRGRGDWLVYTEGLDDDLDGDYNEDGIGGIDLNRNYPENWRPEPGRDLTGRGWTQFGAGAYPLSEPETRSVVLFLLEHPNIAAGQSLDTKGPMILRAPGTSRSEESILPGDLRYFRRFDEEGLRITGYPIAGDIFWDIPNRMKEIFEGLKDFEPEGRPLFGGHMDFGYFQFGAIWYGNELWNAGKVTDYNGDGVFSPDEVLRWNDEALGGRGFLSWRTFDHPQLGRVEIGGYNPKFFWQNPPPEFLEEWARKEALFNLLLAQSLPQAEIVSAEARPGRTPGRVAVEAVFTNSGALPTALEMAQRIKIVKPDTARLRLLTEGIRLIGSPETVELGFLQPGERKTAAWMLEVPAGTAAEIEVSIFSTRGGVRRRVLRIAE